MKYQSLASFEKHLEEAFPDHLSPIYGVLSSCDFERRKMVEKILKILTRKDTSIQPIKMEALAHPVREVTEQLNTGSIFGGFTILFFDGVQQLKKEESEELSKYLVNPSRSAYLILGAASSKVLSELYQLSKKEMVVLDLSDEKPWEKQRRFQQWLSEEAKRAGKILTPDTASYLFDHIGLDMPGLHQELAKLICFVGEKPTLERRDAEQICLSRVELTSWQLAEGIIWGKETLPPEKKDDLSFILPFIGQLRYQLQVGLQLSSNGHVPQLRPQTLDKIAPIARQKKAGYFRKGLQALYAFECAAKSSSIDLGVLFDRFHAALKI